MSEIKMSKIKMRECTIVSCPNHDVRSNGNCYIFHLDVTCCHNRTTYLSMLEDKEIVLDALRFQFMESGRDQELCNNISRVCDRLEKL